MNATRYRAFGRKRGGWHINTHEFPNGDKPNGGGRFFVEAVREELDAEWEWFLDAEARTVELVAPAGLDMHTADVVAPAVAQPFEHIGATGVQITGLNITHTAAQYMLPYDNPSRGDWTIYRGGAVYFEDSANCSVRDCFFDQVGSNGVMVNERNSHIDVDHCRFIAGFSLSVSLLSFSLFLSVSLCLSLCLSVCLSETLYCSRSVCGGIRWEPAQVPWNVRGVSNRLLCQEQV